MLILGSVMHATGSFSSFIDLWFNLKQYYPDIKIQLYSKTDKTKFPLLIMNNVGMYADLIKAYTKNTAFKEETIITTTKIFHDILMKNINVDIKCKHLILLDSWDIMRAKYDNKLDELQKLINKSCDHLYVFANNIV